jgi:hypothetical protein
MERINTIALFSTDITFNAPPRKVVCWDPKLPPEDAAAKQEESNERDEYKLVGVRQVAFQMVRHYR